MKVWQFNFSHSTVKGAASSFLVSEDTLLDALVKTIKDGNISSKLDAMQVTLVGELK